MSGPDMKADENGAGRRHTGGGASETRSWRIGATSPIRKLILVRSRTNDCCPSREVSTQAKRVFPSHRSLAAYERSTEYARPVSALLWLRHAQEDGCGVWAADWSRMHIPSVRSHLLGDDRRSVGAGRLA